MPELGSFVPDWISPPGDTIADILQRQKLSPVEFAQRIGRTASDAISLIRGTTEIDKQTAKRLSSTLGASETFWLNRERQYRTALEQWKAALDPTAYAQWLATVPVNQMREYGWLDPAPSSSADAIQCLRFFGVPTIDDWNASVTNVLNGVSLRTSRTFKSQPGAIAAWLRQGELKASSIQCQAWNPARFRATLNEIRALTREQDPKTFLPELQKRCAACGVAVVVLRAPTMCKASGACRVLPNGVRLILLSARHFSDDHFWFTFFHEAAHLLLHGDRPLYIDVPEDEAHPSTADEREANESAANILVPAERRAEMRALPVNGRRVMRFAREIGSCSSPE
jgi:HTH-type transcriptional regulator/antitoxin HigA